MAALLCRNAANAVRRAIFISSVRASSGEPTMNSQEGKVASDKLTMPDTLGHAVGPERYEMLANLAGHEDPYEMNVKQRAKGTKDDPTLIPSAYEKRLVGCICEEDALSINWMYLNKGESRRCQCGYWFKMVEVSSADYLSKQ